MAFDASALESREDVAIIGGGFAGSLLALRLVEHGVRPLLIEAARHPGPGLAYGKASAHHLLNVPVQRMEIGLQPSFSDWLAAFPEVVAQAVANDGALAKAFVPRALFGRYLREQVDAAIARGKIKRLRAEVTAVLADQVVCLNDGRRVTADRIVLAMGNLPPASPSIRDADGNLLRDHPAFVSDPWETDALDGLDPEASVLLIGTGLTMVDMVLTLVRRGHKGLLFALSRRGLVPLSHADGGTWTASDYSGSPRQLLGRLRHDAGQAARQGVPWQRIIDAVRPQVAHIWASWTHKQKSQFLRHLRPYWDVHRHRLAPVLAAELGRYLTSQRLVPLAGRIKGFAAHKGRLQIDYVHRHHRDAATLTVDRVLNCTGPQSGIAALGLPLFSELLKSEHITPDPLGLGIETDDARVLDRLERPSATLFAIGSLTRPAWWEVTAVPEIAAQVTRLANRLAQSPVSADAVPQLSLARDFFDLGAGI